MPTFDDPVKKELQEMLIRTVEENGALRAAAELATVRARWAHQRAPPALGRGVAPRSLWQPRRVPRLCGGDVADARSRAHTCTDTDTIW